MLVICKHWTSLHVRPAFAHTIHFNREPPTQVSSLKECHLVRPRRDVFLAPVPALWDDIPSPQYMVGPNLVVIRKAGESRLWSPGIWVRVSTFPSYWVIYFSANHHMFCTDFAHIVCVGRLGIRTLERGETLHFFLEHRCTHICSSYEICHSGIWTRWGGKGCG